MIYGMPNLGHHTGPLVSKDVTPLASSLQLSRNRDILFRSVSRPDVKGQDKPDPHGPSPRKPAPAARRKQVTVYAV